MKPFITVWFFALGACLASHACLVTWRLPRREPLVAGRSRCERCGRPLSLWKVLPVAGWFLVRGRCRSCGYRVPVCYPLLEFLAGSLAAVLAWRFL